MKFLCDEMLARLGHWLRAAGYDTAIAEKQSDDRDLLKQALEENRLLVTRDRHFLEMGHPDSVIWLKGNLLSECAQELTEKLAIDWLYKPFSRCLVCNREVIVANDEIAKKAQLELGEEKKLFTFCEMCQRVYWEGSHTQRMLGQLKKWGSS